MFKEITQNKKIYSYNPGEIIKNQDSLCTSIGIVISGEVKISTITNSDKEELISIIEPNDCFGDLLIFQDNNRYLGDVIALKKTQIVFINKDELINILSNNQVFLVFFLKRLTKKAYLIKQQNKLFAHKNIRDRIMYDLNTNSVNNKYTYKSIAEWSRSLSIPRESLSREITKLCNEGIIEKHNKAIYIK